MEAFFQNYARWQDHQPTAQEGPPPQIHASPLLRESTQEETESDDDDEEEEEGEEGRPATLTYIDKIHGGFTLQEALEDLASRFILNVPDEEVASTDRIYFQIEQAHWFYEDFFRPMFAYLPGFSLQRFAELLLKQIPILQQEWSSQQLQALHKRFMAYKSSVPVCGAILLNEALDKVLLVKGWAKRASWTFPKGKINQEESDLNCAIREVRPSLLTLYTFMH